MLLLLKFWKEIRLQICHYLFKTYLYYLRVMTIQSKTDKKKNEGRRNKKGMEGKAVMKFPASDKRTLFFSHITAPCHFITMSYSLSLSEVQSPHL